MRANERSWRQSRQIMQPTLRATSVGYMRGILKRVLHIVPAAWKLTKERIGELLSDRDVALLFEVSIISMLQTLKLAASGSGTKTPVPDSEAP